MRLLVSVRTAGEVEPALAGGADIIDAKEPARGALGPVTPGVLRAIAARVPEEVPFSVALGDFTSGAVVRRAVAAAAVSPRLAPVYLKLGFAGQRSMSAVTALIGVTVAAAADSPARPVVVPVAYADAEDAGSPVVEEVLRAAIAAGAGAFLVDTWLKDGRGLLARIDLDRLRGIVNEARAAGLLVAVAGSLDAEAVEILGDLGEIVGIRGAACRGGRGGAVDAELVRRLRERLPAHPSIPVAG
jgi:(5-formylfuran-3-yl)methyl phosphate synthase